MRWGSSFSMSLYAFCSIVCFILYSQLTSETWPWQHGGIESNNRISHWDTVCAILTQPIPFLIYLSFTVSTCIDQVAVLEIGHDDYANSFSLQHKWRGTSVVKIYSSRSNMLMLVPTESSCIYPSLKINHSNAGQHSTAVVEVQRSFPDPTEHTCSRHRPTSMRV